MLFVRHAICIFECLNKFVMYLVSLPVYESRPNQKIWNGELRLPPYLFSINYILTIISASYFSHNIVQ